MSLALLIYRACLDQGVLLDRRNDDQLGVRRLGGGPLPPDLRQLLIDNKAELLAFLRWREQGRAAIDEAFGRIARLHRPDRDLDIPDVLDAEHELHEAFLAQDDVRFALALKRWRLACYRALSLARDEREP